MNLQEQQNANGVLFKASFVLCIVTTVLSAVLRLFGIELLIADTDITFTIDVTIQLTIKSIIKIIELALIFKILCHTDTKWCVLLAIIETVIAGFLTGTVLNIFNLVWILFVPLIFNIRGWKYSLLDNIILYTVLILYSVTFLYGRVGAIKDVKFDFVISTLCSIDYILFLSVICFGVKIFGGIKLWKKQRRPLFAKVEFYRG